MFRCLVNSRAVLCLSEAGLTTAWSSCCNVTSNASLLNVRGAKLLIRDYTRQREGRQPTHTIGAKMSRVNIISLLSLAWATVWKHWITGQEQIVRTQALKMVRLWNSFVRNATAIRQLLVTETLSGNINFLSLKGGGDWSKVRGNFGQSGHLCPDWFN
jgi:hypothetical protein